MRGYINGKEFTATEFFYDGCHKIYLVDNEDGRRQMFSAGWDEGDVYPIEELPTVWVNTCPLRFINSADFLMGTRYVDQCETARFEGWRIPRDLEREIEIMNVEQRDANGELTPEEYVELMEELM